MALKCCLVLAIPILPRVWHPSTITSQYERLVNNF